MKRLVEQAGTFALNKIEPVHRWYPYIEGYSSCFVENTLASIKDQGIHTIYDPFGGCGTTSLVASQSGIVPYYSETNPFMQGVVNAKVNSVRRIARNPAKIEMLKRLLITTTSFCYQSSLLPITWDGFEKYFETEQLEAILYVKDRISEVADDDCKAIGMLALSSILVASSKMIRRGDLRFAKDGEKKETDGDVIHNFTEKLAEIIFDIENSDCAFEYDTILLSEDARDIQVSDLFDCVITSPPYLNGTNYIRNTKLELKLNGFITSEADLPAFHEKGIIAGINNVSKRNAKIIVLPVVQPYIEKLEPVAYDKRIVTMVAGYFSDMRQVIEKLSRAIKGNGLFIMDIGDSQFAGVHIPTHDILSSICADYGFEKIEETVLRERRSKSGMVLSQRLLRFRLKKSQSINEILKEKAQNFIQAMPYKNEPFSGRNWGHSWHSLCSYHGKLKPAIAHMLIEYFTEAGEVVLDPLCGVGTIPFEACLQGRIGIGNDLSEMAYVVSKAKIERPAYADVLHSLEALEAYIESTMHTPSIDALKQKYLGFGYNGKVADYFEENTYSEILCAREYYSRRIKSLSSAECMVFSCLLHVLHGNRPYALSRNSHPLTPYAPTGEFRYKNMVQHIKAKIDLAYKEKDFEHFTAGRTIWGDYAEITDLDGQVDAIICSPPFAGSIRFYMNNWLRLWLCGWDAEDYKQADEKFLDNKQNKDFAVYRPFFAMCNRVLKPTGRIVLHLGKTGTYDMANEILPYASDWFDVAYIGNENVEDIEKHGIKDKGGTIAHEYLFLTKKEERAKY